MEMPKIRHWRGKKTSSKASAIRRGNVLAGAVESDMISPKSQNRERLSSAFFRVFRSRPDKLPVRVPADGARRKIRFLESFPSGKDSFFAAESEAVPYGEI